MTLHSRQIRKIAFGQNPLNGALAFTHGKEFNHEGKWFKVSSIEEDAQYFAEYGSMRYNVYLIPMKKGAEEFVWKSAINVPVVIEYYLLTDKVDVIDLS